MRCFQSKSGGLYLRNNFNYSRGLQGAKTVFAVLGWRGSYNICDIAFGLMFWNIITSYRFMKRCPVSTHCVASCGHRGRVCARMNVEILTLRRHFIHNQSAVTLGVGWCGEWFPSSSNSAQQSAAGTKGYNKQIMQIAANQINSVIAHD